MAVDARPYLLSRISVVRQGLVTFWSIAMLDIILVAAALGFFALSVGYTIACDRL